MVNNWRNIIQDYLLPPTCILCGDNGFNSQDICQPCYNDMLKNIHCCYRCAEIFETANSNPQLCGYCLSHTVAFDETHAPFIHQGIVRHLIANLKFKKQYKNARLLGCLLANYLDKTAELPELIIPTPLHILRFQERSFNQSFEISKTIAKRLKLPIDNKSCIRQQDTQHQTNLSAKQRHKNIKNAFKLIKPISANHVAIVDDVMTTGSTANELARVLKKSGISRVDIWICARA